MRTTAPSRWSTWPTSVLAVLGLAASLAQVWGHLGMAGVNAVLALFMLWSAHQAQARADNRQWWMTHKYVRSQRRFAVFFRVMAVVDFALAVYHGLMAWA